jgi:serine/threonine protein kinase
MNFCGPECIADCLTTECDFAQDNLPAIIRNWNLEVSMDEVSSGVKPWDPSSFELVRKLEDAAGNHGRVDLMIWDGPGMPACRAGTSASSPEGFGKSPPLDMQGGQAVAVKRMPNKWVTSGPKEFRRQFPSEVEQPWRDLGILKQLNNLGYRYVCELLGIFADSEATYVVTSLASGGDLFSWTLAAPRPGMEREELMLPLAVEVLSAVKDLHELGIAHRDLSLENILLMAAGEWGPRIRIIDFGMASVSRTCRKEVCGKRPCQAPEMHSDGVYDTFLVDSFALGVVLFAMAAQDYPWTSTKQGTCKFFEYATMHGVRAFLEKKRLRVAVAEAVGQGQVHFSERLADVVSPELVELLEGLLRVDPQIRFDLGESCFAGAAEAGSVWSCRWLRGASSGTPRQATLEPKDMAGVRFEACDDEQPMNFA